MSRKQWSKESMAAALQNVKGGMGVREAARLYNLPFETLRRRVAEKVPLQCRSGPPTVLTQIEEDELASYCVKMADMGFGLTRSDIMTVAFKIVDASGRKHPFTGGTAGRAWFDGFRERHQELTLRTPQSLSHARASSANHEVISDYFGKLAAVCVKLNLLAKPMQIYNMDECGVSIVHKPGKVVTEVGRRNVWAITSGEKGKTHTVLACVSAAGSALPPFLIYPRKRITDNLKTGAYAGTSFRCSDSGWVNAELFLEWLHFFVQSIPLSRPVLLILDGHASHISIDAIEFARINEVHMLCIPAHTTHILQPLDVGVFKSFKSFYNKACRKLLADHPHRIITTEQIASLVGTAWPQSMTPVNIMSGFKKCGVYPLNPGEVTDRQIMPSTLFPTTSSDTLPTAKPNVSERDELYKKRYEEDYDMYDEDYLQWIRDNGLKLPSKASSCEIDSTSSGLRVESSSVCSTHCGRSTGSSLSEILALPKPAAPKKKRQAVNSKASCITDSPVLQDLKHRKEEKEAKEEEKKIKKLEREKKKKEQDKKKEEQEKMKKRKKEEREKRKEGKETHATKRKAKANQSEKVKARSKSASARVRVLQDLMSNLDINETDSDSEETGTCSDESEAECPGCGLVYGSPEDSEKWVQCDMCAAWWDLSFAGVDEKSIDKTKFICANC